MINSTSTLSPLPIGKGMGTEFQPLNAKLFSLSVSSHAEAIQKITRSLLFRIVELSTYDLGYFRGVCWLWYLVLCVRQRSCVPGSTVEDQIFLLKHLPWTWNKGIWIYSQEPRAEAKSYFLWSHNIVRANYKQLSVWQGSVQT